MFRPIEMREINLFILKNDLKKVSDLLYELKLIEFLNLEESGFEKFEEENQSDLVTKLLELRSAISILKKYHTLDSYNIMTDAIEKTHLFKVEERELKNEILKLEDIQKRFEILKALNLKKEEIGDEKNIIAFIPLKKIKNLKYLEKNKIFRKYIIEDRVYFICEKKEIKFEYKEFYIPKEFDSDLKKSISEKKNHLKKIQLNLEIIANDNLKNLEKEEIKLSKIVSTNEAKSNFSKTQNVVVLNGFVPKNELKKLKKELENELLNSYELEIFESKKEVPVKLDNMGFSKNFEFLLNMYSLPKYREFDPSILMLFIFPLFYGFILGDVGYGLVSLIVFSLLKIKYQNMKNFLSILQLSSISSIIFGIIYGEYFGFEPYHPLIERAHDPSSLLVIAIIFGIIHINMGLFIGFINNLPNIRKAIYDKGSWFVMEIGILILALGILSDNSNSVFIGSLILFISFILIYKGHGFIGLIEIPSFFTNILSYARLMAVGLSSVVIAIIINQFTEILFSLGIFGIIGGIILFTIGHLFNIVLGNFESFLHTLRLHYVEFFTKFYTGGGREFKAFGDRNQDDD